ncbi:ADAMTS-like protein 1 [Papilio xuthus]|uniref:ADAMTS-like protein 1 n=1 Tax=Papilio xuthus TaxID=66420 RepID=A0A194Q5F0_PAPXU|nr:ADAMTS-like protein 1 [Papilio xuthus]
MHPLIRKVLFHFPAFPYKEKGGKGKRTKLGLRDAHSSDETRNCFHLTPVFCVVVVFHRASRANSCDDVKAGSSTVKIPGHCAHRHGHDVSTETPELAEVRHDNATHHGKIPGHCAHRHGHDVSTETPELAEVRHDNATHHGKTYSICSQNFMRIGQAVSEEYGNIGSKLFRKFRVTKSEYGRDFGHVPVLHTADRNMIVVAGLNGVNGLSARGHVMAAYPGSCGRAHLQQAVVESQCGTRYVTCRYVQHHDVDLHRQNADKRTYVNRKSKTTLRTQNTAPCRGNMSLLEEDVWREQQCSAHDNTPYGGELFHWRAHRDDAEPCALTCRGTPQHSGQSPEPTVSLDDDDRVVVAVLAARVSDGTRCRPGSLDMCIDGRCQRVGCDLRVGSTRRVDECGVCGGDGSSCSRPRYHWLATPGSLCSATCGGVVKTKDF